MRMYRHAGFFARRVRVETSVATHDRRLMPPCELLAAAAQRSAASTHRLHERLCEHARYSRPTGFIAAPVPAPYESAPSQR
jgi:hypothetical protein